MSALLAGIAALGGCAQDPSANWLGGAGDPLTGAALSAPQTFGNTARSDGNPAQAALAAVQIEFITNGFATDPIRAPQVNPATLYQMRQCRAQMRGFLGIPPDAPPQAVIAALRRVNQQLQAGDRAGVQQTLAAPIFTAGPQVTLQRLSNMPRLNECGPAAGMAAEQVNQFFNRRGF